jgi:hypothetical protein
MREVDRRLGLITMGSNPRNKLRGIEPMVIKGADDAVEAYIETSRF